MVTETIEKRGVQDPRVLAAMRKAPRHELVPIEARADSYANHPLPIGFDQTISQPYIVAAMTEAAQLTAGEKVLEVGTVIPVGKSGDQELKVITRRPDGTTSETLMGVRFVPMTGEAQNKSAK